MSSEIANDQAVKGPSASDLKDVINWWSGHSALQRWLAIWPFICVGVRWFMVRRRLDGRNSGILPMVVHVLERWVDEDPCWKALFDNPNFPRGGIRIGSSVLIRRDLPWQGQGRWANLLSLIPWSRTYWFHPEDQDPGMAIPWHRRGHLPRQLTHMDHPALVDSLGDDWQTLPGQTGYPERPILATTSPQTDHDLILVYGSNAVIIEHACVPGPVDLNAVRIWGRRSERCRFVRLFVLLGLISSLALPAAYLYKGVWWYILIILGSAYLGCCGIILLLTCCFAHRQPLGADDECFTAAFHRNAQRIEYTIRMLKTQFGPFQNRTNDEHSRVLHCYLFYRGRKQLLVSQPTPDGPYQMENSWIKLSLPSQSRWWDLAYCAADVSLHALLPWGWVDWRNNSIFLSLQMLLTSLANPYLATLVAILIAIMAKIIGPGNGTVAEFLGCGDNWGWNWYKLLYQLCVGGRWGIADRLYVVVEGYVEEWSANTATSISGPSSSDS